jgi:hypothetical protein
MTDDCHNGSTRRRRIGSATSAFVIVMGVGVWSDVA